MEHVQEQKIKEYREQVEGLLRYIPWLQEKSGGNSRMMNTFAGEGISENSLPFPVYDSTLMGFVKTVSRTTLMDRNYHYQYSRNFIKTVADEKAAIGRATIKDMDLLCGILSKYISGGMTKPALWEQGMREGIYLEVLLKMKKLLDFWDKPLA